MRPTKKASGFFNNLAAGFCSVGTFENSQAF
jgi:hypothetical protein